MNQLTEKLKSYNWPYEPGTKVVFDKDYNYVHIVKRFYQSDFGRLIMVYDIPSVDLIDQEWSFHTDDWSVYEPSD